MAATVPSVEGLQQESRREHSGERISQRERLRDLMTNLGPLDPARPEAFSAFQNSRSRDSTHTF